MLVQYIRAALRHARYEILADDGSLTARFRNVTASMPTPQRSKTVVSNWQRCSRSGFFFVSTNTFPYL